MTSTPSFFTRQVVSIAEQILCDCRTDKHMLNPRYIKGKGTIIGCTKCGSGFT